MSGYLGRRATRSHAHDVHSCRPKTRDVGFPLLLQSYEERKRPSSATAEPTHRARLTHDQLLLCTWYVLLALSTLADRIRAYLLERLKPRLKPVSGQNPTRSSQIGSIHTKSYHWPWMCVSFVRLARPKPSAGPSDSSLFQRAHRYRRIRLACPSKTLGQPQQAHCAAASARVTSLPTTVD